MLSLPRNGKTYAPVNLDRLAHWVAEGRITSTPENPITARELLLSGCIHDVHDGVKVLGDVRVYFLVPHSISDVVAGCRTPEGTHPHHTVQGVEVCNQGHRSCWRFSILPLLQPPCATRLRQGAHRQDICCAYEPQGHPYVVLVSCTRSMADVWN